MSSDYEQADGLLDSVSSTFNSLVSEHSLEQHRIDKWVWNEPSITLSWKEQENLEKNIHVYNRHETLHVEIEVNAWKDVAAQDVLDPIRTS